MPAVNIYDIFKLIGATDPKQRKLENAAISQINDNFREIALRMNRLEKTNYHNLNDNFDFSQITQVGANIAPDGWDRIGTVTFLKTTAPTGSFGGAIRLTCTGTGAGMGRSFNCAPDTVYSLMFQHRGLGGGYKALMLDNSATPVEAELKMTPVATFTPIPGNLKRLSVRTGRTASALTIRFLSTDLTAVFEVADISVKRGSADFPGVRPEMDSLDTSLLMARWPSIINNTLPAFSRDSNGNITNIRYADLDLGPVRIRVSRDANGLISRVRQSVGSNIVYDFILSRDSNQRPVVYKKSKVV